MGLILKSQKASLSISSKDLQVDWIKTLKIAHACELNVLSLRQEVYHDFEARVSYR